MNIGMVRKVNAIICSVAILFFLAHAVLGTVSAATSHEGGLSILAWGGVALIAVHICLAIFITANKKNDPNPPSAGKHAMQWVTGAAILVLVLFHTGLVSGAATGSEFVLARGAASLGVMIGLMVALTAHICINMKGMFEDMGMNSPEKADAVRKHVMIGSIFICAFFVILAAVLILA